MAPHRGALILTLGILSLVFCQFLGFVPWILANSDLREMSDGRMDPEGRSLTEAGKICGIIAVGLAALGLLLVVLFLVFGLLMGAVASTGSY